MANSKISALTSATTPLAGTETLPVVQSSTTKKTAVSTIKDYILGLANIFTANQTIQTTNSTASKLTAVSDLDGLSDFQSNFEVSRSGVAGGARLQSVRNAVTGGVGWLVRVTANNAAEVSGTYTTVFKFDETGNLIPAVAGKGVNFVVNTPAAGKTSQLLNWYEEGTWTPNFTGLTISGSVTTTAKYTRIGRMCFCTITLVGSGGGTTSATLGSTTLAGFPFSIGVDNVVTVINQNNLLAVGQTRTNYLPTWTTLANVLISFAYEVA